MGLTWNGARAQADVERKVGTVLVRTAIEVQSELMKELSKAYPPASRVGEFPHYRTLNLRESIVYEPADPAEAGRLGRVRVGYAQKGYYGAILELFRGRLGLKAIVERVRGKLAGLGLKASASQ